MTCMKSVVTGAPVVWTAALTGSRTDDTTEFAFIDTHLYLCLYLYVYLDLHVFSYSYEFVCKFVFVYARAHTHMCISMHTCNSKGMFYALHRQLGNFSRCSQDIITLLKSSSMAMCCTYFGHKLHASAVCWLVEGYGRGEHLLPASSIVASAVAFNTHQPQRVWKALLGPALHAGYAGASFAGSWFRVGSCSESCS